MAVWSLVGSAGAVVNAGASPMTANAGQASTAGNLLVCRVTVTSNTTAPTLPAGWTLRTSAQSSTTPFACVYVFDYLNNPGSISSVSVSFSGGHAAAFVAEYTCPNAQFARVDQTGTAIGSIAATFNISTSGGITAPDDLAVAVTAVQFSAATTATLTAGAGFGRQGAWNNGASAAGHASFDHNADVTSSLGSTVTDAVGISPTGAGEMAGAIVLYSTPGGTATAPLTLAKSAGTTSSARSGTVSAALTLGKSASATSSARNGGTVSAALSLHTGASAVVHALLSLGVAVTGTSSARSGSSAPPLLSLATVTASASPQRFGGTLRARLLLLTPRYPLHLAGQVTDLTEYDGTLTLTAAHWAYHGTAVLATKDGTAVLFTTAGTLDEWEMTPINITLAEFNDEQLTVTITSGGSPVNLTGYEVDAFFKTKSGVADSDPTTIKLSTVTGEITITSAPAGLCLINLPASDLQSNSIAFYRIDTVDPTGKRNTAIYGTVAITLL